jgi:hypothetical protein
MLSIIKEIVLTNIIHNDIDCYENIRYWGSDTFINKDSKNYILKDYDLACCNVLLKYNRYDVEIFIKFKNITLEIITSTIKIDLNFHLMRKIKIFTFDLFKEVCQKQFGS